jgi:hypothetical protein
MSCRQDRAHNLPVLLTLSPLQCYFLYGPDFSVCLLWRLRERVKMNLLAPMPPGSQLTDRAIPKVKETSINITEVALVDRTPSQEYALRRQSRKLAYRKERVAFFKGDLVAASTSRGRLDPIRSPSRYLQAL